MERLSGADLERALQTLPSWRLDGGCLVRDFSFKDFRQAMTFVNRAAGIAEAAGHHPDIDIRYNKVRIALATHDAGGITDKDVLMAQTLEMDI